ncbi:antibiotic biosynthesis monooxygenase family protein [Streptomyces sp. WMMC905]|uniref:antibiotic biosynthesis monooxygenase family protein n=1 Tax=Streptomyces sp. WMMC905 TaxID=3404123 RepID=UPI003B9618C1
MTATGSPARVRVVRLLRVRAGREADFLRSYREVRESAERVPGHLGEELCRCLDDPERWLLTSEWAGAEAVGRWREGAAHRVLVESMNACLHEDRWTAVFQIEEVADAGGRGSTSTGDVAEDRRARRG